MLPDPKHHTQPFEYFTVAEAFTAPRLDALDALFGRPLDWVHHHGSFYECHMADVSPLLDARWCDTLRRRVAAILRQPLLPGIYTTAQRMNGGQQARVHTDRPLAGYEAARFILQLTRDWQPGDGGVFCTHPTAEGLHTTRTRPPRRNQGVGFMMGNQSYHSVTPAQRERRTVVFNFWHVANPPDFGDALSSLFGSCHFGDLPRSLDPITERAEATHSDDATYQASLVAWLLASWGAETALIAQAYRCSLHSLPDTSTERWRSPEHEATVLIAQWLARCFHTDVDLTRWANTSRQLARLSARPIEPATSWQSRCFPAP